MPNRKLFLWVSAATLLVLCVVGVGYLVWAPRPPDIAPGSVEIVEIELRAVTSRQKADKASSRDPMKIETLLALLRKGKATDDHKCGDSGKVLIRKKDGSELKIGVLAGHDVKNYEFRVYQSGLYSQYDIFRVERPAFLKAIADFGITTELDPGKPE